MKNDSQNEKEHIGMAVLDFVVHSLDLGRTVRPAIPANRL